MAARTVIITGASKGIGLLSTQFLLQNEARVVAVQRSTTPELSALVEKYPSALRLVQGDFTDDAIIKRTLQEAQASFGSIDGIVFNAGVTPDILPVVELPLDDWTRTFDVNFFGVVRFLRAALPALEDGAKVIFISSALSSVITMPASGPYSASKAAIDSLNRTLAVEHPGKVFVAFLPGSVRTAMRDDFAERVKPYLSPAMAAGYAKVPVIEPEVPGRVIAKLALNAPPALSGKIVKYDDPLLSTF